MIYSKYFSSVTKENGQPNLNPDQFRRMMNIVFLEGIIQGIKKVKEKEKVLAYKYDTIIFKHDAGLSDLTGNLQPKELVREMYILSEV